MMLSTSSETQCSDQHRGSFYLMGASQCLTLWLLLWFFVQIRIFGLLLAKLRFGVRTILLVVATFLAFPKIDSWIGLQLSFLSCFEAKKWTHCCCVKALLVSYTNCANLVHMVMGVSSFYFWKSWIFCIWSRRMPPYSNSRYWKNSHKRLKRGGNPRASIVVYVAWANLDKLGIGALRDDVVTSVLSPVGLLPSGISYFMSKLSSAWTEGMSIMTPSLKAVINSTWSTQ